ncbi:MAG: 50S ribosomal protein L7 [bacterium ADurb.Bin429]|nr:MAG: 50S ribosomal protein L7 [bacterium ADurb.Bin429]
MGLSPEEAERMITRCPVVIGRCDDTLEANLLQQQLEEGGLLAVGLREKGADAWTLPPRTLPAEAPTRRFELVLEAVDAEHVVEVAMQLCEVLQYGRKEALLAVASVPHVLWVFDDETEARRVRERLEFTRTASVGLREAGTAPWLLPPTPLPPPPPEFALRLLSIEKERQSELITAVRSLLKLSAADARRLVESAPSELGRFPDLALARELKHQLEREGAAIAVVNAATGEIVEPPIRSTAPRSAGMSRVSRMLLIIGNLALIGLTVWHYVQAGGTANTLGAIFWSVLMLVFALGIGLVTADTVIRLRGVNGARRGISATLLTLGVPALGLFNTRQNPESFFAGWLIVFGVGLVVWLTAVFLAPTAETADGEADVPPTHAPKDDSPTPGGRAAALEAQIEDLLGDGKG